MRAYLLLLLPALMVGCGQPQPPPAEPVATPVAQPPADADADGVPDSSDKCAGSASGVAVGADGCEGDQDGDGVADSKDSCPETVAGERVDASGCKARLLEARELTLKVDFASASAKIIGDAANGVLLDVVELLKQYPETTVRIGGYTDSSGSASGNLAMSKQRAEAVAQVLIDQMGIDASRVTTEGFGDADPIASNETAEGREQNRRVVAVVSPAE